VFYLRDFRPIFRNGNLRFYAKNRDSVQRTAYSGQTKTLFLTQKRASEAETSQGFGCRTLIFKRKMRVGGEKKVQNRPVSTRMIPDPTRMIPEWTRMRQETTRKRHVFSNFDFLYRVFLKIMRVRYGNAQPPQHFPQNGKYDTGAPQGYANCTNFTVFLPLSTRRTQRF
jgi:hypothetical protein